MIILFIEYYKDGVLWKPRYDITSAVSFFKKVAELREQHILFSIKVAEL